MRKILFFVLFLGVVLAAYAQESTEYIAVTDHYKVSSENSQSEAEDVSRRMEAILTLANGIFHFDLSQLGTKMRVRVFRDTAGFNAYLDKVLSQTRSDFVFIAWSDPEKSELLCFPKEEKSFTASLIHQGLIQYLKAFVANPPVWLREGAAIYLESAEYDSTAATLSLKPNYLWLDSLKAAIRGESRGTLIPFSDLLLFTREKAQAQLDMFYPQAWGLMQFLINSPNKVYNRMLWDAVSSLDPKDTLEESSLRVKKRAFSWVSDSTFSQDFQSYVLSLKTAADLVRDGIDLYGKGDLAKSEESINKSIELEPDSAVAWYYLGLIAYSRKDYAKAEELYMKSFQLGTNAAIINYALGVNSFANGKYSDAGKYLKFAKDADTTTYGEKVDALMKRIESLK